MRAGRSTLFPVAQPLPILVEGDPRLRVVSAPIAAIDDELRAQMAACAATLRDFRARKGFGRAMAAPQVGIARRLVVVDLAAGPTFYLNPRITWRSEETFLVWDDCFSVPDKRVRVRRHTSITVEYEDDAMQTRTWERLAPAESELMQHEIDHLDGVLMTDRALVLNGDDAVRHRT